MALVTVDVYNVATQEWGITSGSVMSKADVKVEGHIGKKPWHTVVGFLYYNLKQ